jgi:hypothetical protein
MASPWPVSSERSYAGDLDYYKFTVGANQASGPTSIPGGGASD